MADERIGLTLDLGQSTPDAKKLADALEDVRTASRETAADAQVLTTAMIDEAQAQNALSVALKDASIHTATANSGFKNIGNSALAASYAIQDFTSQLGTRGLGGALASIQNNIPQFLVGLGAGAGLTGVVSVAAVGVGLLYENWDKLADLWKDGETLKEAERQKELAKALTETREATQKLLDTPAKASLESGGNLRKAITEFGGAAVRKELENSYRSQFGNFDDATVKQGVEDIIGGVFKGDPQSRKLLDQMTANNASDISRRIKGQDTRGEAAQKQQAQEEKEMRDAVEAQRKRDEAAKLAKAADAKLVQELNDAGRAGEQGMDALVKKNRAEDAAARRRAHGGAQARFAESFLEADAPAAREFAGAARENGVDLSARQAAEAGHAIERAAAAGMSKDQAVEGVFAAIIASQGDVNAALMNVTMRLNQLEQRANAQRRNFMTRGSIMPQGQD